MADCIEVGKTATISSPSHSVRAMLSGGETMFAARDVLAACGIKYPDKWMKRNGERFRAEKLEYPLMTGCGIRRIRMFFITAACANQIVQATSCQPETLRWLKGTVFAYKIGETVQDDVTVAAGHSDGKLDTVGKMVDEALFGLLEIKKYIAGLGAAG